MLSFLEVNELLEYAPELGGSCLKWKVDRVYNKVKGKMAGTLNDQGYYQVRVNCRLHLAHRLVWLLNNGVWPANQIDHMDRNRVNNQIGNLREATNAENGQNQKMRVDNTSGCTGVSWITQHRKWQAKIKLKGRYKHLGLFESKEDAANAYAMAKAELHTFNPKIKG